MGRTRPLLFLLLAALIIANTGCGRPERLTVWLIGVDGADWRVIDPLIESGRAPSFATLKRDGVWGELQSLEPMLSPLIWTSIITGRPPREHGITWFMVRNRRSGRAIPVTSSMRQSLALWNILSARGFSVSATGWWASWPAETVNGWIASDHLAYHGFGLSGTNTGIGLTYPPSLLEEIRPLMASPFDIPRRDVERLFPISDAEFATAANAVFDFANPLHHTLFALATLKRYRAIARHLDAREADFNCVYFEFVDTMSHLYMKYRSPRLAGLDRSLFERYRDTVDQVYEMQDEVLADWINNLGENEIVIVVSDHGFKTERDRPAETGPTAIGNAHLWHRNPGIVALFGHGVREDTQIENASVLDIAPTILFLFGLPVPEDLGGRVLREAFTGQFLRSRRSATIPTYETTRTPSSPSNASDIDPGIEARLRSLGYIGEVGSAEVDQNRAEAFRRNGQFAEAMEVLDSVPAGSPFQVTALLTAGDVALEAGWPDRAYERYRRALVACRTSGCGMERIEEVHLRLAAYYHIARRFEESLRTYDRALESAPLPCRALLGKALVLRDMDRREEALETASRCLESEPDFAAASDLLERLEMERRTER